MPEASKWVNRKQGKNILKSAATKNKKTGLTTPNKKGNKKKKKEPTPMQYEPS
jgi:hypothetical protein